MVNDTTVRVSRAVRNRLREIAEESKKTIGEVVEYLLVHGELPKRNFEKPLPVAVVGGPSDKSLVDDYEDRARGYVRSEDWHG